jgi:hypothetical protein
MPVKGLIRKPESERGHHVTVTSQTQKMSALCDLGRFRNVAGDRPTKTPANVLQQRDRVRNAREAKEPKEMMKDERGERTERNDEGRDTGA